MESVTDDGGDQPDEPLQAPAWDTRSFGRTTAGLLRLAGGRLSFVTKDGTAFDLATDALEKIKFGSGDSVMKLRAVDRHYRLYFAQPKGVDPVDKIFAYTDPAGPAGIAGELALFIQGASGFKQSCAVGKKFKASLGL